MKYVNKGQLVYADIDGHWLLCEVATSMGITARVINKLHNIDTWRDVSELVNKDDYFKKSRDVVNN